MTALQIAGAFSSAFARKYGTEIDEMKLHKMLYLAQRESLIRRDRVLFGETIYAWQFGPVIREVRDAFLGKKGVIEGCVCDAAEDAEIIDYVFQTYAGKTSWSLSRLTHCEMSWKNARRDRLHGGGNRPMLISDIRKDAERIRERRRLLGDRIEVR